MAKIFLNFFILYFLIFKLFANEVPIIVISPSKKAQSLASVGSSVIVFDEKFLENSNEYFLGDVLSKNNTSSNFFQTGGPGSTSAIQLRGLPKRYTTVYIDGIKMSDPSSVSNDFDFNHILTNNISRVEILKGNQSSIYGSGAIGGTINITTKKGQPGLQKDFSYNTGSYSTHNFFSSLSGATDKNNFFIGIERFQTDGISQMTHNDEKDAYRNTSLLGSYDKIISDNLEINGNTRIVDTYLQYDKEINTPETTHNEEEKGIQSTSSLSVNYKPNKKNVNKLTLSKMIIKRIYNAAPGSGNLIKDNYTGDRDSISLLSNYNFNLDNNVVFGFDVDNDQIKYNKDLSGISKKSYHTFSKYFDYQKRLSENFFITLGSRFDKNSIAGDEEAHRSTVAYLLDNKSTKLKASYGTGFRFPSLYELYYIFGSNSESIPNVKAEKSKSYEIGIEKNLTEKNLNLDITYFNIMYKDSLESWESNLSSGSSYTYQNTTGKVKSQGIEFSSFWEKNKFLSFNLNYTYTSTFDGAEADDPNRNQNFTNNQIVRVPRNLINLQTNFRFSKYKNLDFLLNTKWSDMARDYGNGNRTFSDERTDDYLVNDFYMKYNLWNEYNLFFNITNIFNEKYETARDYSQMDRSFNVGIKKVY
jgi:vitamin B12 transporter